jgi:hypothetical protein
MAKRQRTKKEAESDARNDGEKKYFNRIWEVNPKCRGGKK